MGMLLIMAQVLAITTNFTIGEGNEMQFRSEMNRIANSSIIHVIDLPAGTEGVNTSLPTNIRFLQPHDFSVGDTVDLHWTTQFGLRGILRGTVINFTNTFNIGFEFAPTPPFEGTGPPELATTIVSRVQVVDTDIDPTLLVLVAIGSPSRVVFYFRDVADTTLFTHQQFTRGGGWFWMTDNDFVNPLTSGGTDVDKVIVSNGEPVATQAFIVLYY